MQWTIRWQKSSYIMIHWRIDMICYHIAIEFYMWYESYGSAGISVIEVGTSCGTESYRRSCWRNSKADDVHYEVINTLLHSNFSINLTIIRSLLISPYKFMNPSFVVLYLLLLLKFLLSCLRSWNNTILFLVYMIKLLHMHIVLKSFVFISAHQVYLSWSWSIAAVRCRSCCKISLIIDNVKHWNVEIVAETGRYLR